MCGCEIYIFTSIIQSELNVFMMLYLYKLKDITNKYSSRISKKLFIQRYEKVKYLSNEWDFIQMI